MNLRLYSNKIDDYLKIPSIIDYDNKCIQDLAEELNKDNLKEIDLIKSIFEYVRDNINHTIDVMGKKVTSKASEVLIHKEGICYAKSHLLAALLRYHKIPAGFCYQKLILCDESAPYKILHGLLKKKRILTIWKMLNCG
ncbi:MAG: transglutaminase-like domain-containing protein [Eubacteriaceae bacterium]